jgi:hypothetical protein
MAQIALGRELFNIDLSNKATGLYLIRVENIEGKEIRYIKQKND